MRGVIKSKAENPNGIEYTVSIKLPISDWVAFLEQVQDNGKTSSYPSWHIIQGIRDCIHNAKISFEKEIKSE